MYQEHEAVVLTERLRAADLPEMPEEDLQVGTFGYVVSVLGGGEFYLVEFFDQDGHEIEVIGVRPKQIRAATKAELTSDRLSA